MSVQVSIPLEKIEARPAVAAALSALLNALGQPSSSKASATPVRAAVRRSRPRPTTKSVTPAGRAGKTNSRKPQAARAGREGMTGKLVDLLRERGSVTSAGAMKALGIKDPKVLGGLIGGMARWAKKRAGGPRIETKTDKRGKKVYSLSQARPRRKTVAEPRPPSVPSSPPPDSSPAVAT